MIPEKDLSSGQRAAASLYRALAALNEADLEVDNTLATIAGNVEGELAELVAYITPAAPSSAGATIPAPAIVPEVPKLPPPPPAPAARRPLRPGR